MAAFIIIFAAYGMRFSYGVYFKPMAAELGYSSAVTAAAFSVSMFLEGVFSLVLGGLTDKYGPRIVLTCSSIVVGTGYFLMPFVHSPWQLYTFYGLIIGVGMGGIFVPMVSITARWFTARRNLMTGLVSSGAGIGMLIIPVVSSRLIENLGWRSTFVIMGIVILVVVLIAAQFLKRDPSRIGALPYGEKQPQGNEPVAPPAGFSFSEAIRLPQFWFLFAMMFWYGFYSSSINVHIVPDAINAGMAPTTAANIMAVSGGLLVIGRIILGTTADKIGNKRVFIIGFILSFLAMVWIILNQAHWAFFLFAVFIGFSQGGIGTSQSPITASLFGLRYHGLIFGCIGLGYTFGAAFGPFITGLIFDLTGSYHLAMIVCTCTCIVSLVLACLIRPVRNSLFSSKRL
ncbi:MAG: MFS transporter [Dehalococcoidales bacterium]|nr:MFS transporter [Dehalococcoidales bacterium]